MSAFLRKFEISNFLESLEVLIILDSSDFAFWKLCGSLKNYAEVSIFSIFKIFLVCQFAKR